MKIKAALVDLNDTICNTSDVERDALKETAKLFSDLTEGKYSESDSEKMLSSSREYINNATTSDAAAYDTALYLQHMVENADIRSDRFELLYRLQDSYYKYMLKNLRLYDDAEEFLQWLKESGRKVAIISDGTVKMKLEQIHELGIGRYVDLLVTSEESGSNKPAPNSYMLAMHKLKMSPSELFVIGNSLKLDIYGANMLGMVTVEANLTKLGQTATREGMFKPRYTVDSLAKVRDIIEFLETSN
ncbi:MAG: HAD family hydrolase [Candidatus Dojkabacteria bacterium]|nr:MAG: HAD family hydrolase [Candidatus Dojkabacteria bacterium]